MPSSPAARVLLVAAVLSWQAYLQLEPCLCGDYTISQNLYELDETGTASWWHSPTGIGAFFLRGGLSSTLRRLLYCKSMCMNYSAVKQ
jgi:hypothetical protein